MLPEVTEAAAADFLKIINSGEISIDDLAKHLDRENRSLKIFLAKMAAMYLNNDYVSEEHAETHVEPKFNVASFVEGMLLTYAMLHYQQCKNENRDPGFVRPENWWNGSEWFNG